MSNISEKPTIDQNEFDLPETLFIRDIDDRVFHSIIEKCLSKIDGVNLPKHSFFERWFVGGKGHGVSIKQDIKKQAIAIRIEVMIGFGVAIPEKAAEIQKEVATKITQMTGLHVSCVHVVIKNVSQDGTLEFKEQLPCCNKS